MITSKHFNYITSNAIGMCFAIREWALLSPRNDMAVVNRL